MPDVFAQSTVVAQQPGDPGYAALHAAAVAPLHEAFGNTVVLDIERLDRLGRWAFVMGTMRARDGSRPDYAGTPFEARSAAGSMSDLYVALLRESESESSTLVPPDAARAHAVDNPSADMTPQWQIVDQSIGPSDVAWLPWPERHAAPRHLFGF